MVVDHRRAATPRRIMEAMTTPSKTLLGSAWEGFRNALLVVVAAAALAILLSLSDLGYAQEVSAQQFSTSCMDVKVEIVPNPAQTDNVCISTFNAHITYEREEVDLDHGQSSMSTISGTEAKRLLDNKLAWVTLGACTQAANRKPRKQRKQARLDCESAYRPRAAQD